MRNHYLGGARRHDPEAEAVATPDGRPLWRCQGGDAELFLEVGGEHFGLYAFPDVAILLRGHATFPGAAHVSRLEDVARQIHAHYLRLGELPVEGLEGSFTLALLDGRNGRMALYRNLVGTGYTYYGATPSGLLFASNLADLVDARDVAPRPNERAIPALFLYRSVPGRETLFDGVYRLMPGEMVTWDPRHGHGRVQRQTLDALGRAPALRGDAAALVEQTLAGIVTECAALRPGLANLLSGGVDSSYLQVLANRAARRGEPAPSFSISVDHPSGRGETEYALSASRRLDTQHTLVPADRPYADYLLETLASTAELPNHVQAAYFGPLARAMTAQGVTTGLCGEGADNLFGIGSAGRVQAACLLKRWLPVPALRGALARLASAVGWTRLHDGAALANRLGDWGDLGHPVNQVSAFTDWEAAHDCFGARGVAEAAAYRRSLLADHRVGPDPLGAMHALGYLADAMDTASLWTTLFNREGGDLVCPFMDSRLLRLVFSIEPRRRYPFRNPKGLLKAALVRQGLGDIACRPKRGFGQPIFEWLAPGGQLRPYVERMAAYPFVDRATLARTTARPTWFLYSLLCYDLWHKLFIDRSLPRRPRRRAQAALAG